MLSRDLEGGPDAKPEHEFGWPIRGVCAWAFGVFSTAHSNGTNKVIDTACILCYLPSCTSKLILAWPRSEPLFLSTFDFQLSTSLPRASFAKGDCSSSNPFRCHTSLPRVERAFCAPDGSAGRGALFASTKSFIYHTSEKSPPKRASDKDASPACPGPLGERASRVEGSQPSRNPCICHTSLPRVERAFCALDGSAGRGALFASTKSFIYHTYRKSPSNSFHCHTSKITGLEVLCLPHIRTPPHPPHPQLSSTVFVVLSPIFRLRAALCERRRIRDLPYLASRNSPDCFTAFPSYRLRRTLGSGFPEATLNPENTQRSFPMKRLRLNVLSPKEDNAASEQKNPRESAWLLP
jgi:hypothetical protein